MIITAEIVDQNRMIVIDFYSILTSLKLIFFGIFFIWDVNRKQMNGKIYNLSGARNLEIF